MKRTTSGQEAIEFALIGGLVFCVAIGTMLIFGNKIASFFQNDSAIANTAKNSPNTLSSNNSGKYSAEYETYAANPEIPAGYGETTSTTTLDINGITVTNIPENISTTIKTSGASGVTDLISGSISDLSSQLKAIADSDPSNTKLQALASKTKLLAEAGYKIADAEEWIEIGSMRFTMNEPLSIDDVFEGNTIQEGGTAYSGDNTLQNKSFLFDNKDSFLLPTLNNNTKDFLTINSEIQTLANDQSKDVKAITEIIKLLTTEVNDISGNVSNVIKNASNSDYEGFDYLNSRVASETTDLKSELIESQVSKEEVLESIDENITTKSTQ